MGLFDYLEKLPYCPLCGSEKSLYVNRAILSSKIVCKNCQATWETKTNWGIDVKSAYLYKLSKQCSNGFGSEYLGDTKPYQFWQSVMKNTLIRNRNIYNNTKKELTKDQIRELKNLLLETKKLNLIEQKINDWKKQGYNVEEIEKMLKELK